MRADRLLRLLMLLQRHRRLTAARLAAELEVSERTVLRDMEALSAAGVPVWTERGHGGGCVLMDDFTTDASGITSGEAQALFAWSTRETATQLGLGGELASGLAKIAATAPRAALAQADELGAVLHADRRGWFAAAEHVPLLPQVREAVVGRRRLRVRYTGAGADRPSVRTLDPIGLVDSAGRWYLLAEHRRRMRTYRVSRLHTVAVLDEPARPVDTRPLAAIWDERRVLLERRHDPVEVTVRVDVRDRRRTAELHRLLGMQLAPGGSFATVPDVGADGTYELWTLPARLPTVVAAMAVMFAPELTVVSPSWLPAQVRTAARRALAHYGGEDPSEPSG